MSNKFRLRRRQNVCAECAAGNHTGAGHRVCPYCGHRLEDHALIGPYGYLCDKTGLFVRPE